MIARLQVTAMTVMTTMTTLTVKSKAAWQGTQEMKVSIKMKITMNMQQQNNQIQQE